MAGNPVAVVKRQWRDALDPLMPMALAAGGDSFRVPVSYRYPGDQLVRREHVWFHGASSAYGVHSMRAGRRRRDLTVTFDVVCEVRLDGVATDDDQSTITLQEQADARAQALAQIVDEHIADEEHMASSELVDVAQVVSSRDEYGDTDTGVWSRVTLTVSFKSRPL